MDFRQLECFVAVAEELHFGLAASRLFMTQPPVSRQIRLLEDQLAVQLFIRDPRGVTLTAAGTYFLTEARRLLSRAREARLETQRVAQGEVGTLNLGFTAGGAYRLMPRLVASATRVMPGVTVALHQELSVSLVERLREGSLDVALVRRVRGDHTLHYWLLEQEPLMAALPEGHPLAQRDVVSMQAFDGQDFIAYSEREGRYFHDLIDTMFANHDVSPRPVQVVEQTHTLLGLVRERIGIGVVPASASEFHPIGVVFRKLQGRGATAAMYAAWREGNDNPVTEGFLKQVVQVRTARARKE